MCCLRWGEFFWSCCFVFIQMQPQFLHFAFGIVPTWIPMRIMTLSILVMLIAIRQLLWSWGFIQWCCPNLLLIAYRVYVEFFSSCCTRKRCLICLFRVLADRSTFQQIIDLASIIFNVGLCQLELAKEVGMCWHHQGPRLGPNQGPPGLCYPSRGCEEAMWFVESWCSKW